MNEMPFAASFDALAQMLKWVRAGANSSRADDQLPGLCQVLSSCAWDRTTEEVFKNREHAHYVIGWHDPADVSNWPTADMWGTRVAVDAATVRSLDGKQLVLRPLESRGTRGITSGRQLFMAVPLIT